MNRTWWGRAPSRSAVEICVRWGTRALEVVQLSEGQTFELGGARFPMESPGLALKAERAGVLVRGGGVAPRCVQLAGAGAVALAHGPFQLEVRAAEAPVRAGMRLSDLDFGFPKLAAMLGLAAIALAWCFAFLAEGVEALPAPRAVSERWIRSGPPAARPRPPLVQQTLAQAARMAATAGRSPAPGGGLLSPRGGGPVDAMKQGLLGALDQLQGLGGGVLGGGGLGKAIDAALGGLRGGGAGAGLGLGGVGSRGTGPGGPGGGLSLGGLGAAGAGPGPGLLVLRSPGGGAGGTTPPGGTRKVVGGLPRDEVMRVVRRHQSEIKHCYEAALQREPSLAGKVTVVFTIDATGAVGPANVAESTLASQEVEACMVERIGRWRFPEPAGGGEVEVSFPWVFHAAGGEEP